MPLIDLAKSDFGSVSQNVPRLKVSNMYITPNPISVSGVSYVARPALSSFATISSDNIRGIFTQDGSGQTTVYVVSGNDLYTVNLNTAVYTKVGSVPGSDFCTFSCTIYHIGIVSDGNLYLYDGTTVTSVVVPDGQIVADITSLDNYFIVGIKNSNKFYWIKPGETTINALNFISAERNPDDIVTVMTIGDEMWAVGQSTVEIFTDTGDAAAPFRRINGRVYQVGCVDKHSLVKCNKDSLPCLIWVTPTKEVILAQGVPAKVSNESIEELLKKSSTFTAWTFRTNRHDFYVLTTDNETLVFDITTGGWFRWFTYTKQTWNAYSGIQINDNTYCVNKTGSTVYKLVTASVDTSTDYLVCEVSGFMPNPTNNSVVCKSITLFLNYGYSPTYTSGPLVELRWSDDGGTTFTPYYQRSLGVKGVYDTTARFRSLGSFNRPGRFIELRFSDIATFRLDGATLNDSV